MEETPKALKLKSLCSYEKGVGEGLSQRHRFTYRESQMLWTFHCLQFATNTIQEYFLEFIGMKYLLSRIGSISLLWPSGGGACVVKYSWELCR